MFYQTFTQIPIFGDNHKNSKSKNSRTAEKLKTRLEQQKHRRFEVLSFRRFNRSELWDDSSHCGYQSDESSDSRSSVISLDQISQTDILQAIFVSQPLPQSESVLNTAVSAVLAQIDSYGSDFDVINQMAENFFSKEVLNKMSTFIGAVGIRPSTQIKIVRMFEDLAFKHQLSDQLIHNLINSSLISKLIEIQLSGNEVLVERSLQTLLLFLEMNYSAALLKNVVNCGLIDVLTLRADVLRWKTTKVPSSDIKASRRQLVLENSFSSVARVLFRQFAKAIYRLLSIDMDDGLRAALLTKTSPLIHRLIACPDSKVIPTAIDSLRMLTISKNASICSAIVQDFGDTLFAMTGKNEEPIIFSILLLFNSLVSCPQVYSHSNFVSNILASLERIVKQKNNSQKVDKAIIDVIASVSQWVVTNVQTIRQFSNRLIYLSYIVLDSGDRLNQIIAVKAIETVLCKYSFDCLVNLLKVFDIRPLLKQLLVSNDQNQQISLDIIAHFLSVMCHSFNSMPEEVEKAKLLLFSKESDIYYCLEKLSYKTYNDFVSNRAHHLLQLIDGKLTVDEDVCLLPKVDQNGFVFGINF